MKKILILMSTFNGQDFLAEQLDSILSQSDVDIHLLVRDDGSVDETLNILNSYRLQHPGKIDILEEANIGWKKSYFRLTQVAHSEFPDYDYYSFADQDDIWKSKKIKMAVDAICKLPDGPQLYCSNLSFFRDGIDHGLIRKKHIIPSIKGCLMRNYATGCTILFNARLLDLLAGKTPNVNVAHDHWCYMLAVLCGAVVVDDNSFILYRQHNNNQIGSRPGKLNVWKRRLKSISELIGHHDREKLATELIRLHYDSMTDHARQAVCKLADYRNSFSSRIALLSDSGYTLDNFSSNFWIRIRIILGRL